MLNRVKDIQQGISYPAPIGMAGGRRRGQVAALLTIAAMLLLVWLAQDFVPRRSALVMGAEYNASTAPPTTTTTTTSWSVAAGDVPQGSPLDPTRSDWLITQSWQQHRANEGTNFGALDFGFRGDVNALGSPIHATQRGVAYTLRDAGAGNGSGVYILGYVNPSSGESYNTVYGHLSKLNVADGQQINRGDSVGERGGAGNATGPRLRYEVWHCQTATTAIPTDRVHHGSAGCQNVDPAPFVQSGGIK